MTVSRRLLLRATGAVACTVSVMFPGGGSEDDDFKPVFEAFAQKQPRITVEWTPGGTGGYNDAYTEKLTGLFAAGSGPDVFKTTQNLGSFAASRSTCAGVRPRSPTVVSYPKGSWAMKPSAWARPAASTTTSRVALGRWERARPTAEPTLTVR